MDRIVKTLKYYIKLLSYLAWKTWNRIKTTLFPTNLDSFLGMFVHSPRYNQPQWEKDQEKLATIKQQKITLPPVDPELQQMVPSHVKVDVNSKPDRWSVTVADLENQYAPNSRIPLAPHIMSWEFGDRRNPTVILVHGFAGRGLQMAAIAQSIVKQGFHVLLCDFPGCGQSPGNKTMPLVFIGAMARIAQQPLPGASSPPNIVSIVAHSMGVLATTGAAILYRRAFLNDKEKDLFPYLNSLVLIAGSESVDHVLRVFSKAVGVSDVAYPHLLEGMSRPPRLHWNTLNNGELLEEMSDPRWRLAVPKILIVHDDADKEVDVGQGRLIQKRIGAVKLDKVENLSSAFNESLKHSIPAIYWETRGLGHKRILKDATVCDSIAAFVKMANES